MVKERLNDIITQDIQLKEILNKIDWEKYLAYGSVRIQIRAGKKTLVAIERTYPD